MHPYSVAQRALADLKSAIYTLLLEAQPHGLTNAQLGRKRGIYMGHVGHEGHIPRTLLAVMENEGVVQQDKESKRWVIRQHDAHEER